MTIVVLLPQAVKAKKELGWEPKIDLEEGIRRYINWYRAHAFRDKA